MQMTNDEIIRRYKAADDRRKMIRILSELIACPKKVIRQILMDAGLDVPATGNRYTAAKKEAEETESSESKRKKTGLKEAVDNISVGINAMVRDAAEGLNKATAKDRVEASEADGSRRKLTEKGRRLLKNDESTENSDLSAPGARTAESPYGFLPDADEAQIGWRPEQKIGTMSEDPGKRMFGESMEAKKAAPTCCQPSEPVDIWDEDTIKFAKEELRRLNELIEAMGQDVKRKQLEIQANKCKAEYLWQWLRDR